MGLNRKIVEEFIEKEEVIKLINSLVGYDKNQKFLIGGVLRDIYYKKNVDDIDFIITGKNGRFLVREIAKKLRKRYSLLENKKDETYRIVYKNKSYDFSLINSEKFEANIFSRDFTINSIAYDIKNKEIVDLVDGITDLKENIIRVTSSSSISDDPLRILRGIRFFSILDNSTIEEESYRLFKENSSNLIDIAPERIRDELLKILNGFRISSSLKLLSELSIDKFLFGDFFKPFPDNQYEEFHNFNLITQKNVTHSPEKVNLEFILCGKFFLWHLWNLPEIYKNNSVVFYKKIVDFTLKRWRFSNKEIKFSKKLVENMYQIFEIIDSKEKFPDWIVRKIIHEFQENSIILISMLYIYGNIFGRSDLNQLSLKILNFLKTGDGLYFPRLIDGTDLKNMGIKAGPEMGKLLNELLTAQYSLKINSRQEAMNYIIKKIDSDNL